MRGSTRRSFGLRRRRAIPFVLALVAGVGCAQLNAPLRLPLPTANRFTQEELRAGLAEFASHFHLLVSAAADTISERSEDRAIRKRALRWKLQVIPLVQEAAIAGNPQEGFVSMLTLVVMIRQYVTEGEGRAAFGEQQDLAVGATKLLEDELVELGGRFLDPQELAQLRADVDQFARAHPVLGGEFAVQTVRRALAEVETTNLFRRVVDVPLSPFRALERAGDTPAAIRDFTAATREFVRAMQRLPEQTRWQVELLLYDAEDRETVVAALAALESLATSADRASAAAEALPADLRSLLEESDPTLARVEALLEQARAVAEPLRETARELNTASASWQSVLAPAGKTRAETGRPFDVREWESAAREIGTAAGRLQQLAVELRTLSDGEGPLAPVAATLERADVSARGWIDHAAWRALELLLGGFVLLLVYRLLAWRLQRTRPPAL